MRPFYILLVGFGQFIALEGRVRQACSALIEGYEIALPQEGSHQQVIRIGA